MLMYLARNFIVNLCIKKFDATIKNICSASATIAVYIIGIMLNMEVFAMSKIFSFIVLIALVGLFFQAENIEFPSAKDAIQVTEHSIAEHKIQDGKRSPSAITRQDTTIPTAESSTGRTVSDSSHDSKKSRPSTVLAARI